MKSFVFELDEKVEYSHQGDQTEGSSVTFYAPKPNQRKKTTQLKQMFFRALPTDGDADQKSEAEPDIKGTDILFLIAQSDADYPHFIEVGRSLVCDRTGKVDDVEFLTTVIADKLDIEVLEEMIGEYVANFIVRSALASLMKNSSQKQ